MRTYAHLHMCSVVIWVHNNGIVDMVNSSSNGDSMLYKITFTIQLSVEGNLQTVDC